jgi:PKD repeat protein
VITYLNTFTKNPAFGSTFLVGNVAGAAGKMLIIIQWYGTAVTLVSGSTLCTLNFTYTATGGTTTTLAWFDNISSCEYADGTGDVLIDLPKNSYYHDGVVAPALIANFSASNLTPLKNEPVQFSDLTSGGATSWTWSFDRPGVTFVNGTSAISQNPQVIFTDGGPYSVTLLCTNNYFSDNEIKTAYLRAGISGLWTGNTSNDWNTQSNWDNWLVPGSTISVVIPAAATNWPVYDGDLTIGVQCGNLTLSGTTSVLTITGNLTLP